MARIAVGGFQHETNTFAPTKAGYDAFVQAGAWPGLTRGAALFDAVAGINLPVAGFLAAARAAGHELLPLTWCAASPSAQVTEAAYERIVVMLLDDLAGLSGLDGLYLDLHGAMVTEHLDDGEGELLARIRRLVGPDLPIVVSLDLHANVSPAMAGLADRLVIFRTYPHVDMAETGRRTAQALAGLLAGGGPGVKAFRQIPFLIPTTSGCTLTEPARGVYEQLAELEAGSGLDLMSFACGFCPADVPDCGPAVLAYGDQRTAVEAAADALRDYVLAREADFALSCWQPADAVAHAIRQSRAGRRPIVLADAQDNAGGGANADTTWLIEELRRQGAEEAVVGLVCDPAAAAAAHAAGQGAKLPISLGAKSGLAGHRPVEAVFDVECLGDGRVTGTGPFYAGARMELGPTALLRLDGIRIVVASRKQQAADQAMFRHLGVEPKNQAILVLKSAVHFRADFEPIAEEILVVAAPGPCTLDNRDYPYRNLRPGLRVMPGDAGFGACTA